MNWARAAAAAACGLGTALAALGPSPAAAATHASTHDTAAGAACVLLLTEHRSGRPLLRLHLPEARLRIGFVHSVLGTPVEDHYLRRGGAWHLVEERFEGQGYGLPHTAGPGEQLLTEGHSTRLLLDRRVEPLVVRPLPAQRMRLLLGDGRQWLLGDLSQAAVQFSATGC